MKSWEQLTALEQCACTYSDMYKDCYGVRPRFDQSDWTVEDYEREFAVMGREIEAQLAEENVRQAEAIAVFEETVANSVSFGATNREVAIRWIMNGELDVGYFEFQQGIPYGYLAKTSDIEKLFAC